MTIKHEVAKGTANSVQDKTQIEAIIRSDVILRNLYKRSIPEVITYADGLTNADVKPVLKALLILAWIMVRRLTR
jgi:hypothetical protein